MIRKALFAVGRWLRTGSVIFELLAEMADEEVDRRTVTPVRAVARTVRMTDEAKSMVVSDELPSTLPSMRVPLEGSVEWRRARALRGDQ